MSHSEEKADIQVTRPGHIFPFGSCGSSPLPHLTQCCRFSVPERLPLQPFRQDRLPRLPLPPSLMASSCKNVALTGAGVPTVVLQEKPDAINPQQKIHQLEKNISFIQESHSFILHSLHEEIEDLKQKNRELQFQLVTGVPAVPPEPEEKKAEEVSVKLQEKIEKLEKEVKKLRNALKDALKTNTVLSNQIEMLKRDQYASSSSSVASSSKTPKDYTSNTRRMCTPNLPSPEVEEYSDTLRKIQKATGERNSKSSESHYMDRSYHGWGKGGSGYVENPINYHYHHRMRQQAHNHGHQQQPRLPRLPLRNQQQNYMSHHQYQDLQYRQSPSGTLPNLKQSHNDHQSRQRKSRGPQPAKVNDQIYNR